MIYSVAEVVVTGTKTFKRQPDCQTCNYTQLRMNGLSGGYSQILNNGRPVFSYVLPGGLVSGHHSHLIRICTLLLQLVEERSSSLSGSVKLRGNYNKKVQLEAGFTLQTSLYDEPVAYIEGEDPRREFLRTPNHYGCLTLSVTPGDRFNASLNGVYTGPMELAHYAGAPEQSVDAFVTSDAFFEFGVKLGYTFKFPLLDSGLKLFGGVKNLANAYQDDFDTGKNRDSGYI